MGVFVSGGWYESILAASNEATTEWFFKLTIHAVIFEIKDINNIIFKDSFIYFFWVVVKATDALV